MPLAVSPYYGRRVPYAPQAPQAPSVPSTWNIPTTPYSAGQTTPAPYPSGAPSYFQPRTTSTPTDLTRRQQRRLTAQQSALGPTASQFFAPQAPLKRRDIPLMEVGLNYEQLLMAERDRQRAYEELVRSREAIGSSPAEQYLRQQLESQIGGGGPFTDPLRAQMEAGLRQQAALAWQAQQQSATADFARRGLGGGFTPYQMAGMQQQSAADLASQITDFQTRAAIANEEALRQMMGQYAGQTEQESTRRAVIDSAIAELFGETQRAPIDLSALIARVQGGRGYL